MLMTADVAAGRIMPQKRGLIGWPLFFRGSVWWLKDLTWTNARVQFQNTGASHDANFSVPRSAGPSRPSVRDRCSNPLATVVLQKNGKVPWCPMEMLNFGTWENVVRCEHKNIDIFDLSTYEEKWKWVEAALQKNIASISRWSRTSISYRVGVHCAMENFGFSF